MIFACLYICVVIFIGHPLGRYGHHESRTPNRTYPHYWTPAKPTPLSSPRSPCCKRSPELDSARARFPRAVVRATRQTRAASRRTFARSGSSRSRSALGTVSPATLRGRAIAAITPTTSSPPPWWRPVSSGCPTYRDTRARITRETKRMTNVTRATSYTRVTSSRSGRSRSRESVTRAGAPCPRLATVSRRARRVRSCDWSIRPEPCPLPITSIGLTIKEPRYVPRRQPRPSGRFHLSASFQFRDSPRGISRASRFFTHVLSLSVFLFFSPPPSLLFLRRLCPPMYLPAQQPSRRFCASRHLTSSPLRSSRSSRISRVGGRRDISRGRLLRRSLDCGRSYVAFYILASNCHYSKVRSSHLQIVNDDCMPDLRNCHFLLVTSQRMLEEVFPLGLSPPCVTHFLCPLKYIPTYCLSSSYKYFSYKLPRRFCALSTIRLTTFICFVSFFGLISPDIFVLGVIRRLRQRK